jgi:P-type Ca2+ transporter type 2C
VLLTIGLQRALIYMPALNAMFKTSALSAPELAFCVSVSAVVFFALEVEKWLVRRGRLYGEPASP